MGIFPEWQRTFCGTFTDRVLFFCTPAHPGSAFISYMRSDAVNFCSCLLSVCPSVPYTPASMPGTFPPAEPRFRLYHNYWNSLPGWVLLMSLPDFLEQTLLRHRSSPLAACFSENWRHASSALSVSLSRNLPIKALPTFASVPASGKSLPYPSRSP